MRQALAALTIAFASACALANAQESGGPQMGLRLSAEYSMQWSGGRIYLVGDSHDLLDTGVTRIHEIWPGSVPGSFAVYSDRGVGLLMGQKIVAPGRMFGEATLLRSGRVELVCGAIAGKHASGATETRFVEWRTPSLKRDLVTVPSAISDFDVDASSRIVYLTSARKIFLLADTKVPGAEIVLPKEFSQRPERVFIDAVSSEVVVYGGNKLAIFTVTDRTWNVRSFDVEQQALVRHAASRRIRPEERFR